MKLRPGMTATVSIIAGEAKNVLRVPNAALRFTPNLPAEEIQKIMKEAGERMAARRQQEGGGGQTAGGPGPELRVRTLRPALRPKRPGPEKADSGPRYPARIREPRRPRGRG